MCELSMVEIVKFHTWGNIGIPEPHKIKSRFYTETSITNTDDYALKHIELTEIIQWDTT